MKRLAFFAGALLACSCSSTIDVESEHSVAPSGDGGSTVDDGGPPSTTCSAALAIEPAAPVAELRTKVPLAIALDLADAGGARGDHPLKLVLSKDGAPVKTLVDTPKAEGLVAGTSDGLGKATVSFVASEIAGLEPGKYTIEGTLGCPAGATSKTEAKASSALHVARLGAKRIDVGAAGRVPLMYHAVAGVAGNAFPITASIAASSLEIGEGEADLDDAAGAPRTFPAPWSDVSSPKTDASGAVIEEGVAYPVSLKAGTKPELVVTMGATTKGAKGNVPAVADGAPKLRVVIGKTNAELVDGVAKLALDASPVPAVGRYDVELPIAFEAARDDGAWVAIPGAKETVTLRLYGVLGNEIGTTAPNLPWVAVVDAATTKVAGKSTSPEAIRGILVQMVYEEFGLKYDRKSGASAYTSYSSGYGAARFELASFLKRSRGSTVNCTDCASILSTYANMIGVKLHYAIIGWNFSLNPILGIGGTTPGSPFDSGRMSFSYHAVTTPDATKTIDDATLALDGDADPTSAPFTKKLVQDVPGAEYLTRLSPGAPEYKYADQITTVR